MQCVAVCCSVLQCVAVCCSMLQCVAACCSVLQCVAERFEITKGVAHEPSRLSLWKHIQLPNLQPYITKITNNLPNYSTAPTTMLLCGAIAFFIVEIYTTYQPTTLHTLRILPTLQPACLRTLQTLKPCYCAVRPRLLFWNFCVGAIAFAIAIILCGEIGLSVG